MRTRLFGWLLLLSTIIFLSTACTPTNKTVSSSNSNKSTNVPSNGGNISTEKPSQNNNPDSFDVNVSIHVKVTLDDKVKGVNPNIIRATRQALFDWDCDAAKFSHYNGFSRNYYVNIFDVIDEGNDTWEVRFREKEKEDDNYNMVGYSFATVKKQASGSYEGYIDNPGGPEIREDETY